MCTDHVNSLEEVLGKQPSLYWLPFLGLQLSYRVAQKFVAKFRISILPVCLLRLILVPVKAEVTSKEEIKLQVTVLDGAGTLLGQMARFISVY
jgi:hypothetical protein